MFFARFPYLSGFDMILARYLLLAAFFQILAASSLAAGVSIPEDSRSAVILAYGRVGEDAYQENNITKRQFLAHVKELDSGKYNVLPLPAVIEAIKHKRPLPPRTVAITFEEAYKSTLDNALPALLERNIPFTIFYAGDHADSGSPQYISWKELKSLGARENVSFGILPSSGKPLGGLSGEEIRRQINKARQKHRENMGMEAALFSYPQGEYDAGHRKIISEAGFAAAFGQQSGSASEASDIFSLPRFMMTENSGDMEQLWAALNALPFPVSEVEPQSVYIGEAPPLIGFSAPQTLAPELKKMSCLIYGEPVPKISIIGARVEIRAQRPFHAARVNLNCTLPGPVDPENDRQLYRWFGMLLANAED